MALGACPCWGCEVRRSVCRTLCLERRVLLLVIAGTFLPRSRTNLLHPVVDSAYPMVSPSRRSPPVSRRVPCCQIAPSSLSIHPAGLCRRRLSGASGFDFGRVCTPPVYPRVAGRHGNPARLRPSERRRGDEQDPQAPAAPLLPLGQETHPGEGDADHRGHELRAMPRAQDGPHAGEASRPIGVCRRRSRRARLQNVLASAAS
jgi:hypothetical protein